jgi:hypothetical protein
MKRLDGSAAFFMAFSAQHGVLDGRFFTFRGSSFWHRQESRFITKITCFQTA